MSVLEQKRGSKTLFGSDNDALVMLIILNCIITAAIFFIRFIYQFSSIPLSEFTSQITDWFVAPADWGKLATRPWTIISFMFTHLTIWGLIGNMLWLWAFGYILQDLTGNRRIAPIYILGGFAGFLFFELSAHIFPSFSQNLDNAGLVGANASVMAIAVAATIFAPSYRIFPMINGGIPLWILTAIFVIINFAGNAGGYPPTIIAHVAGAGMGFLFANRIQNGQDWGEWMGKAYDWFFNLFTPGKKYKSRSVRKDVFYNTKGKQPFKKTPNLTQQKIDELLDKINQKGYDHLSEEEKDLLRRASEEDL
ncbi:MAG: hypothetical protein C5B52_12435 [Bacteroidetes bacterium]|nr:MAG: hypothetical protein C5B52_12435 [Bacteroidota bacterium]